MSFIHINHYLFIANNILFIEISTNVATSLVIFGILGIILNYSNLLVTILCIELSYIGLILLFLTNSIHYQNPTSFVYTLITLITVSAESTIGLGLIIVTYTFGKSINLRDYQELRR